MSQVKSFLGSLTHYAAAYHKLQYPISAWWTEAMHVGKEPCLRMQLTTSCKCSPSAPTTSELWVTGLTPVITERYVLHNSQSWSLFSLKCTDFTIVYKKLCFNHHHIFNSFYINFFSILWYIWMSNEFQWYRNCLEYT